MTLPTVPALRSDPYGLIQAWVSDGEEITEPHPPLSPVSFAYAYNAAPYGPFLWRETMASSTTKSKSDIQHVDFETRQGDTFRRVITVYDPLTGGVLDPSLWTWSGQVRLAPADSAPTVKATFAFTDLGNSRTEMRIEDGVTSTLSGTYVYDVEIHSAALPVKTIMEG